VGVPVRARLRDEKFAATKDGRHRTGTSAMQVTGYLCELRRDSSAFPRALRACRLGDSGTPLGAEAPAVSESVGIHSDSAAAGSTAVSSVMGNCLLRPREVGGRPIMKSPHGIDHEWWQMTFPGVIEGCF
jgi:hypothetical protein